MRSSCLGMDVRPIVRRAVVFGVALLAALTVGGCGGGASQKSPEKTQEDAIRDLDTNGKIRVAQSYFEAGRAAEAIDVTREALESDPENAAAWNYYGQLLLLAGRLEPAEKALREALRIDPYMTDAHNNLGAVYGGMGRSNDAEREFLVALDDAMYPTPEKVYLNLGLLYDGQGRLDEAMAMLRKAVEIDTKFYQAHFELAGMLERAGKLDEAVKLYEVAAPGYRAWAPYQYRIGFAYFRLGDNINAREHLSRVEEIAPGSESAAQAAELLRMMD